MSKKSQGLQHRGEGEGGGIVGNLLLGNDKNSVSAHKV